MTIKDYKGRNAHRDFAVAALPAICARPHERGKNEPPVFLDYDDQPRQ
jgi:hypothetical protein